MKTIFSLFLSIVFSQPIFATQINLQKWQSDNGIFSLQTGWLYDDTKSGDVLVGILSFEPSAEAHACNKIGFIQAAQVKDLKGQDLLWPGTLASRNKMRSSDGYFVDHDSSRCEAGKSCSPFFNDWWPDESRSKTGEVENGVTEPAGMADFPFGWTAFNSIRLEACAVCADDGEVYGCVKWGATWPSDGPRVLETASASEEPSENFIMAVQKFVEFYQIGDVAWSKVVSN